MHACMVCLASSQHDWRNWRKHCIDAVFWGFSFRKLVFHCFRFWGLWVGRFVVWQGRTHICKSSWQTLGSCPDIFQTNIYKYMQKMSWLSWIWWENPQENPLFGESRDGFLKIVTHWTSRHRPSNHHPRMAEHPEAPQPRFGRCAGNHDGSDVCWLRGTRRKPWGALGNSLGRFAENLRKRIHK